MLNHTYIPHFRLKQLENQPMDIAYIRSTPSGELTFQVLGIRTNLFPNEGLTLKVTAVPDILHDRYPSVDKTV